MLVLQCEEGAVQNPEHSNLVPPNCCPALLELGQGFVHKQSLKAWLLDCLMPCFFAECVSLRSIFAKMIRVGDIRKLITYFHAEKEMILVLGQGNKYHY